MNRLQSEGNMLLGFAGSAGVGKTTTAEWFVDNLGYVKLSYATPLKVSLSILTGLPLEYFLDIKLKEKEIPGLNGITPRILMQKMGTDFVRNMIDHDFWIWRMRQAISDNSHHNIVIDDIRFDNEAQLVRDNGGVVVHLVRDFRSPTKNNDHPSEQQIMYHKDDIVVNSLESVSLTAKHIAGLISK